MKSLAVLSLINRVRALKGRPLASLSVAEPEAKRLGMICSTNPLYLGTQAMPFTVIINQRKTPRDFYDDDEVA